MDEEDEPAGRDQGKQRKILLLLAPLFVILLVIQGPTLLGLISGSGDEEPPPTAATADAESLDGGSAPAESALGADVANATPTEPVFVIVHSDLPPRANENELTTLSRFDARDPFIPGVDGNVGGDAADESDEGSSAEAAAEENGDSVESDGDAGVPPSDDNDAVSGDGDSADGGNSGDLDPDAEGNSGEAEIQVNGSAALVRVGSAFPAFDPVFRLESFAGDAVRIGLVRGSYSTGSELVDIEPGEVRTLISQPDGTRYRIRLVGIVN